MRALKTLVIGMAVLIFAGVVVLIIGIIDRSSELGDNNTVRLTGFGSVQFELPFGAVVQDTDIDDNRILLRIKLADGGSRLILLSVATGMQVGTVDLKTGP